eukprot:8440129-Pyramimonas_sp.AAC.2
MEGSAVAERVTRARRSASCTSSVFSASFGSGILLSTTVSTGLVEAVAPIGPALAAPPVVLLVSFFAFFAAGPLLVSSFAVSSSSLCTCRSKLSSSTPHLPSLLFIVVISEGGCPVITPSSSCSICGLGPPGTMSTTIRSLMMLSNSIKSEPWRNRKRRSKEYGHNLT